MCLRILSHLWHLQQARGRISTKTAAKPSRTLRKGGRVGREAPTRGGHHAGGKESPSGSMPDDAAG